MSILSPLAMAPWETTELNPLTPSPVALLALLIIGSLVFVALVAAGVFLGTRMASRRGASEPSGQQE